jgi:hypothetical protein
MQHYHACSTMLAIGSVILPGNWWRIQQMIGTNDPIYQMECMLENVRVNLFPQKPSRQASCFVCPDIASIKSFISTRAPCSLCYKVEFITPDVVTHSAPYDFFSLPDGDEAVFQRWAEIAAKEFWNWDAQKKSQYSMEVFAESPIRIISPVVLL